MAKETLASLRRAANMRQIDVADALGITQAALSGCEHGRTMIRLENVKKLAKLYHVSCEEVIDAQMDVIQ